MSSPGRLALLTSLALALGGCESCGAPDHVAELREATRRVERDHDAARESWEGAPIGARFVLGDGVRTGPGSEAVLALGRDGAAQLRLEASTTVRFLSRPADEPGTLVDVTLGSAVIEAGEGTFSLHTRFGTAILEGGSRARLSAGDEGLDFSVLMGRAVFDAEEERELSEGDSIRVELGGAILDPEPEPEPGVEPELEAEPELEPEPATGGTVRRLSGRGGQVRAREGASFEALGDEAVAVADGASLRVSERSTVELTRGSVRTVLRGRGEYVVGGEGGEVVRVRVGGVSVEAASHDVAIAVPGGTIVARGAGDGSAAELDVRSSGATHARATRGEIEIRGRSESESLTAGESAVLSPRGELEVGGRGPARADFVVGARGAITIHDPRPPTALGIRFGDACPGRGVVELMRGGRPRASSTGEGSANLSLPPGTHSYRVRCASAEGLAAEAVATGSVHVVRDSGVSSLPPSAPTTFIDTDGRTYRVMYQTHLPDIVVRWPRAPAGGSFVLSVTGNGAPQSFRSAQPRVQLASGTLRVGSYRLRFGNGQQQSRETPVEVRFDNAMSTATIRSPSERGFSAGETVSVEGIALPGWRVIVGGHEIEPSAGSRFSTTTTAPTATEGFAIELSHPSRGRHFYVRRARGSQ